MDQKDISKALNSVLEELSAIEHERWALWQKYMHNNGNLQADGSLLLPADLVDHWEKQIDTPYESLSEKEKESDREQVRKYLPTIVRTLVDLK